jgi:hypothetical protein
MIRQAHDAGRFCEFVLCIERDRFAWRLHSEVNRRGICHDLRGADREEIFFYVPGFEGSLLARRGDDPAVKSDLGAEYLETRFSCGLSHAGKTREAGAWLLTRTLYIEFETGEQSMNQVRKTSGKRHRFAAHVRETGVHAREWIADADSFTDAAVRFAEQANLGDGDVSIVVTDTETGVDRCFLLNTGTGDIHACE